MKRARNRAPLAACLWVCGCASVPPAPPTASEPPPPAPVAAEPAPEVGPAPAAAPPPPISIAAVGDIMLGTDYPDDRLPPQDGAGLLADVAETLRAADIAFGNLEGVLLDGGEPFKVCRDPTQCYLFRTPARYVSHLQHAGFDVLSLANNHARDFGEDGRTETMRILDEAGIRHSGREGDIASWQVQASQVALIAFGTGPGSYSMLDIPAAASLIAALAAVHDLVIVSFHGGAEGLDALQLLGGMESYLGEERGDPVAFARAVIDAGADLVLGHGPHVPRALEIYRERLIAYSLGNFATYTGISVAGIKGLAPILVVTLSAEGQFLEGRIESARQVRPYGPRLDPSAEAFALMQRLSETRGGARAPRFQPDGAFFP